MTRKSTKTVNSATAETTEAPEKRKRSKRPQMDLSTCVDATGGLIPLDEKERLTAIPSNWTPNFRRFARSNFADKGHFYEWMVAGETAKIEKCTARIDELNELATEAREGPDPTKKALRKLQRMAKVAAELRAQLEAEGVDLSELDN